MVRVCERGQGAVASQLNTFDPTPIRIVDTVAVTDEFTAP